MHIRDKIQGVIDEVQFQFDVFPPNGRWSYQPLPWLGINKTSRTEGSLARLDAIQASIRTTAISTGMDIGSNVGYFCFSLAKAGISMLGVESDSRNTRIAQHVAQKLKLPNIGWLYMMIDSNTVSLLPQVDLTLVLSVWHHWVREYGFECANEILSRVWAQTNKVLFFETGENEMPSEFGLPSMGEKPQEWLIQYLGNICVNSEITHLGTFKAFAPNGNETKNVVYRNLFKVAR